MLQLSTPFGSLHLGFLNEKLAFIDFPSTKTRKTTEAPLEQTVEVAKQILQYLDHPKHRFTLDLHIEGTPFQKTVWKALQQIPSGTVVSYQTLAQQLKTSPRAIGNACRRNPLPIVIPCHRVVAKTGLGGYSGATGGKMLAIKKWLLRHEGIRLPDVKLK